MGIHFSTENITFRLKGKTRIKNWITTVIQNENKRVGEVNYLFCDDAYMLQVNMAYLNHDTYTDIITFDSVEGNLISGDILISIDRVRENAQLFACPFEQELSRVIIHGVLHLLGNPDKSEEEALSMRQKENDAIQLLETM